jgi:hypothetical protein
MGDYASLVSALAAVFSSLGLLSHSIQVPLTSLGAKTMAASTARSAGVAASDGKTAYARAPFHQPALRYLYSVGWVGAASNLTACKGDLLFGDPVAAASAALRASPVLLGRLRAAHLSVGEASTAIGRGFRDGCR